MTLLANTTIKVLDSMGQTIAVQQVSGTDETIDLSNYPKGIYLLHLSDGKNQTVYTTKISLQ